MALLRIRKPDGEIVEIASLPGAKGDKGEKGDVGAKGDKGEKGDAPEKGVDYYTEADKAELIAVIENEVTGDIETALDSIITIQESLIATGGIAEEASF